MMMKEPPCPVYRKSPYWWVRHMHPHPLDLDAAIAVAFEYGVSRGLIVPFFDETGERMEPLYYKVGNRKYADVRLAVEACWPNVFKGAQ